MPNHAYCGIALNIVNLLKTMFLWIRLIEQGMGIGVTHVGLMEFFPQWVKLFPDQKIPPLEHWCVCHGDIQFSRKIQLVMHFLGDYFSDNTLKF